MKKKDGDNIDISSEGHHHHGKGNDFDIDIDGGGSAWGKCAAVGLAAAGGLSLVAAAPFVVTQIRSPLPYMATPRRKVVAALDAIASGRLNTTGPGLNGGGVYGSVGGGGGGCQSLHRRRRYLHLTDLGSGDGEVVLAAASAKWTATGIELNPTLWAVSSLRRWTSLDADGRRRTRFVWGDMFSLLSNNFSSTSSSSSLLPSAAVMEADAGLAGAGRGGLLASSDAVMIFGVKSLMGRVASLLREGGAKPGTYVLSYRFRLPLLGDGPQQPQPAGHSEGHDDNEGRIDAKLVYDVEDMRIYVLNDGRGVNDDDDDDGECESGDDGGVGRGA